MKIGIISDLHLDFYVFEKDPNRMKKKIAKFIKQLKPEKSDILLLAGDQGHYNFQVKEFIIQMLEFYDNVCFVEGNHDLYLINSSQLKNYNINSHNRLFEMEDFAKETSNVHYLKGNVIEINGIKIGGYGNWYDLNTGSKIIQWNNVMNDSNLIYGGKDHIIFQYGYGATHKESTWNTQEFRKESEEQMQNIIEQNCDILLTHIIPIIRDDDNRASEHVDSQNNIFYETDDAINLLKTKAKLVVFGHTHEVIEFKEYNIDFKSNALGYPSENTMCLGIKHFEYIKD